MTATVPEPRKPAPLPQVQAIRELLSDRETTSSGVNGGPRPLFRDGADDAPSKPKGTTPTAPAPLDVHTTTEETR